MNQIKYADIQTDFGDDDNTHSTKFGRGVKTKD